MAFMDLQHLESYCQDSMRRSRRSFERHGPILDHSHRARMDESIWSRKWVPDSFDLGEAMDHPVFQERFSPRQKLAWNHLQWTLEYVTAAQGEMQTIVVNGIAVRRFQPVCPAVCELLDLESEEELDHSTAFFELAQVARQRYFAGPGTMSVPATAGFQNAAINRPLRRLMGVAADRLFGPNFPTVYFLTRGIRSHQLKPFEMAIRDCEEAHPTLRRMSELHCIDESRHIATSRHLCRMSNSVLERAPSENKLLFRLALEYLWPKGRVTEGRLHFWRSVLFDSTEYEDIPQEEREALWSHVVRRMHANMADVHPCQQGFLPRANRISVEQSGLQPELKKMFVDWLRDDPYYAALMQDVRLPAA